MGQSYQSYQSKAEARAQETEEGLQQIKQRAQDAADTVATEGARMMKNAGERAETTIDAARRFVQEQPLLALGVVAVFACAAGALWSMAPRRRSDFASRLSDYVEPGYQAIRRRL